MKYLYHGSPTLIKDYLEPRSSAVIENEEAVFGTDSLDIAMMFLIGWDDCDFSLGYHHNRLYLMEVYHKAFDKFKNASGYIYKLDSSLFTSDKRLGMKQHEFISKNKVPIIETIHIDNVYEKLKESPTLNMITFDEVMNALYNQGLMDKKWNII